MLGFLSMLMLVQVSVEAETIYQCVAKNSSGSNLASGGLAVTEGPGLRATPYPQKPAAGCCCLHSCRWNDL